MSGQILINSRSIPLFPSTPLPVKPRIALTPDQLHLLLIFARVGCEHTISMTTGHNGRSATFRELLGANHPPTILTHALIANHDADLLLESIHAPR